MTVPPGPLGPGTGPRPLLDEGAVGLVFKQEFGQAVATLVRVFGDIDVAEDAVQEAFVVALRKWPETGVPPNPGGWITTTARRRAIDRLRREARRNERHARAALEAERRAGDAGELMDDDRLRGVLAVVYLIFNEGHTATSGATLGRADLSAEAIRLGRLLATLMPDEPEVLGLLALMLLTDARRPARTAADGSLVLLAEQDRARWDARLLAEGQALVRACLRRNRPGPYQLQAAIAAVHSDAASAADTDWRQILRLYDQLMALAPTPVVALNRAVALAEVAGPAAGLEAVAGLELERYHLLHATRADLLRRLGRTDEAAAAYDEAARLATNPVERGFLEQRRAALRP